MPLWKRRQKRLDEPLKMLEIGKSVGFPAVVFEALSAVFAAAKMVDEQGVDDDASRASLIGSLAFAGAISMIEKITGLPDQDAQIAESAKQAARDGFAAVTPGRVSAFTVEQIREEALGPSGSLSVDEIEMMGDSVKDLQAGSIAWPIAEAAWNAYVEHLRQLRDSGG